MSKPQAVAEAISYTIVAPKGTGKMDMAWYFHQRCQVCIKVIPSWSGGGSDMEAKLDISAVVVSILALLFTTLSFWWMNWRRGKLVLSNIRTYAAVSWHNSLIIQLPIVFFNSGAMPVLVNNLRLTFPDRGGEHTALFFSNTVEKLATDQGSAMATPFPVHGGEALLKICGFHRNRSGFCFEVGEFELNIEGLLDQNSEWKVLKTFKLKIRQSQVKNLNSCLIAQDNEPQISQS